MQLVTYCLNQNQIKTQRIYKKNPTTMVVVFMMKKYFITSFPRKREFWMRFWTSSLPAFILLKSCRTLCVRQHRCFIVRNWRSDTYIGVEFCFKATIGFLTTWDSTNFCSWIIFTFYLTWNFSKKITQRKKMSTQLQKRFYLNVWRKAT